MGKKERGYWGKRCAFRKSLLNSPKRGVSPTVGVPVQTYVLERECRLENEGFELGKGEN